MGGSGRSTLVVLCYPAPAVVGGDASLFIRVSRDGGNSWPEPPIALTGPQSSTSGGWPSGHMAFPRLAVPVRSFLHSLHTPPMPLVSHIGKHAVSWFSGGDDCVYEYVYAPVDCSKALIYPGRSHRMSACCFCPASMVQLGKFGFHVAPPSMPLPLTGLCQFGYQTSRFPIRLVIILVQ
jgi:hypothetical protein